MKIAITADSVIDLTPQLISEYDIKIIPLNILLGDVDYKDNQVTSSQIFDFVAKTGKLPKTSAASQTDYEDAFKQILTDYDKIIHFSLSSEMSVTHLNAVKASKNFGDNVEVIDSRSLSTGVALQTIYARELTKTETDIKVIADKVRQRSNSVQASFVIEELDYLHKGGRCSSVALLAGKLLKIRPQIIVKDGKMGSYRKYRGPMVKCIKQYCQDTLEEFCNFDKSVGFVTYSSATQEMIDVAKNALIEAGFEKIYETQAGGTISSHCGPNTLGILYYNDKQ